MSLSKTLYLLLSTGSTQEDRKTSQHDRKIVDWDLKHSYIQNRLIRAFIYFKRGFFAPSGPSNMSIFLTSMERCDNIISGLHECH